MASLGQRIGEYRRKRNITQEQLAEAMGVTPQAVSKWENDISCPDISLLPQLADYFNVSLDVLLRGEESRMVQMRGENEYKDFSQMLLRVTVDSSGGDVVRVNLPLPLVKIGFEIGQMFQTGKNDALNEVLNKIDVELILKLAESGIVGNLVEVSSANGDVVKIFIE